MVRQQTLVSLLNVLLAEEARRPGTINVSAVIKEILDTFEFKRRETILLDPFQGQAMAVGEATLENQALIQQGSMRPPAPTEKHDTHLQIHGLVDVKALDESAQMMLQAHMEQHMGYLEQMQKAAGQTGSMSGEASGPSTDMDMFKAVEGGQK